MSRMGEVQSFVKQMDYLFYQSLIEVLIPDVLRPVPGETVCLALHSVVLTCFLVKAYHVAKLYFMMKVTHF